MKAVQPNLKMEAKKTRRAVTQWLRLTTQSRLGQKPSQLFILKNFDLKPCPVFHSQEEWVKTLLSFTFSKDVCQKSREPAQVSQLTVTVPGIVGQYQTGDKIHLKELKNIILLHLARSGWKEGWRDCNWFPCREIHLRED